MLTSSSLFFVFRLPNYDNYPCWIIGIVLVFVGIIGEAVADQQLEAFKKKGTRGGIFASGLWTYSRHPNLFFELVVWLGFALGGIDNNGIEALGFISVVILWAIMRFLTLPITEEYMEKTRPVTFKEFKKRSNMFLIFKLCRSPPLSEEMKAAFEGGEAGKRVNFPSGEVK
mmetsp:Transcript_139694/g.197836  ORF Transcript_139694/g.197836 Transcript_139694/m.197836 type:complete len:171 (-) Transcript_139694:230-742(-)